MADFELALVGDLQKHLEGEQRELSAALRGGMEDAAELGKRRFRQQITRAGLGARLAKTWRSQVYPRKGLPTMEPAALIWSKAPQIVDAFSKDGAIRSVSQGGWLAIPTDFAPASRKRGARGRRMSMADFLSEFGNESLAVVAKPGAGGRVLYAFSETGFRRSRGKRKGSRRVKAGGRSKSERVLMYTLVKQVRLGKRFDVALTARIIQQATPDLITRKMLQRLGQ
ncbi:conserved hypothetical protein [Roseibium sp. TrichSKD4]|uniref:DUF6441 family protein n=1 Tax=Roseibium sp. TrichSKD4 TaxID=744980 RepID=UPI0001E56388|nr:DUF6441 family protein [Roseibium sp. TrichSKD4]EFO33906.1 conserved hypothetical protein [Roseibium sp. TrichSKD4]